MGRPRPLNGQNFKIFVFGRRDFIFAWYVAFYVRKSLSSKTIGLGPLWAAQGPKMVKILKFLFLVVETSYLDGMLLSM